MNTKKIVFLSLTGSLALLTFSFRLLTQNWNINTKDAKIHFVMPQGKHDGTLGELNATFQFDPMAPEQSSITAKVQVKTIDTGIPKLNEHLQSADFFDAANHPEISFTSSSITKNDTGFVATGKLSMRDSTHVIALPFRLNEKDGMSTFSGTIDIFAGDYGVGKKSESGKDRVVISIEVPVAKQ